MAPALLGGTPSRCEEIMLAGTRPWGASAGPSSPAATPHPLGAKSTSLPCAVARLPLQPPNLTLPWPQAQTAGSHRGQQTPWALVLELIPHTKTHTPRRGAVCPRHPAAVMGRDWTTAADPCVGTAGCPCLGTERLRGSLMGRYRPL